MRSFPDGRIRLELANRQWRGNSWQLAVMQHEWQPRRALAGYYRCCCNNQHLQRPTVATITATRINIQVELIRKFNITQNLRHQWKQHQNSNQGPLLLLLLLLLLKQPTIATISGNQNQHYSSTRINIQLKPFRRFCIIQLEAEVVETESEQRPRVLATTNYCCNNQQSQQEIRWSRYQKQHSVNNSILITMRTNATANSNRVLNNCNMDHHLGQL